MKRVLYAAVVLSIWFSTETGAQSSRSSALAKQLTALMEQQQLEAIATTDSGASERFIAALYFPQSQLLVVSAQYPVPSHIEALIERRAYREVYQELQSGSTASSRVFFQDLGADGLSSNDPDALDILYEHGSTQTVFSGDPKKRGLPEKRYGEKFLEGDAEYSRLLAQLVAALKSDQPRNNSPSLSR